jgi:hypothetical protein
MKTRIRRRGIIVVVAAAAIALGVGVAKATIPDAVGTINGCYAIDGGTLRVIDTGSGATCDAGSEVPLDWNVTGAQGTVGPVGPQGPQGFPGQQGSAGGAASSGYEEVSANFTTGGNGLGTGEADCPNGKLAVGGGVAAQTQTHPIESRPTDDGGGWIVTMRGSGNRQYSVYAICVTATAKGGGL